MMNKEFANINGTNVDVTTVMDTTVEYKPTEKEANNVQESVRDLLTNYFDYLDEGYGIRKMFNTYNGVYWENKGWLINAFSKHPCYNGNYQIVLRGVDMCRHVNEEAIETFFRYVNNYLSSYEYRTDGTGRKFTFGEAIERANLLKQRRDWVYLQMDSITVDTWNSEPESGYMELYEVYENTIESIRDALRSLRREFYPNEVMEALRLFDLVRIFCRTNTPDIQFCNKELADEINELHKSFGGKYDLAASGQKISRIVGKIAKICNLDKHVDIRETSFLRADGALVTRTKDMGWNYQFAQFADAVNPISIKATAVISVNPIDYYTMSFGNNWSSCHTIDKKNQRMVRENHYHGMYCGGCQSYLQDNCTVVFYFLPEGFNGEHPELEDKVKRCLFYLGEDKIIQSRAYPDGRDGGEESLAKDIRTVMQKVTAEIFDVPNYWTVSKGTEACEEVTTSEGVQYPDYESYEDCNVSYMKRIDGYKNKRIIPIGRLPICPECGEEHEDHNNIFCPDCVDDNKKCEECGCVVNRRDAIIIDDHIYCYDCVRYCDRCNEYVAPDDEGAWIDDEYICEDCLGRYYTYCDYDNQYCHDRDVITTEEGNSYIPDSDGYGTCDRCGHYHDIDELHYDDETGEYYCDDCYEELLAEREEESEDDDE